MACQLLPPVSGEAPCRDMLCPSQEAVNVCVKVPAPVQRGSVCMASGQLCHAPGASGRESSTAHGEGRPVSSCPSPNAGVLHARPGRYCSQALQSSALPPVSASDGCHLPRCPVVSRRSAASGTARTECACPLIRPSRFRDMQESVQPRMVKLHSAYYEAGSSYDIVGARSQSGITFSGHAN